VRPRVGFGADEGDAEFGHDGDIVTFGFVLTRLGVTRIISSLGLLLWHFMVFRGR